MDVNERINNECSDADICPAEHRRDWVRFAVMSLEFQLACEICASSDNLPNSSGFIHVFRFNSASRGDSCFWFFWEIYRQG